MKRTINNAIKCLSNRYKFNWDLISFGHELIRTTERLASRRTGSGGDLFSVFSALVSWIESPIDFIGEFDDVLVFGFFASWASSGGRNQLA